MPNAESHLSSTCPRCGTALSSDERDGGCPRCLTAALFSPVAAAPPPATRTESVRLVGDYELLEEIARGGMGIVFKAHQISLNRIVAVKMIAAGHLASPALMERFHTEAEAAANLDHPNIVPIYEVGEQDGHHYFSMRLVEGGSLADQLKPGRRRQEAQASAEHGGRSAESKPKPHDPGCYDPKDAARLMVKVSRGVHYAHQHGILHRDLKPGNILLDAQGEPHLTDFGLAKLLEADSDLTRTEAALGTPSYMSPEQASGQAKQLTTAADIYSLGAILYELLTGKPPFKASNAIETMRQVVERLPVHPRLLNPQVDRDLETICLKCLEKDPAQRYASANGLANDLERWLRHEPILARPTSTPEHVWKWLHRRPPIFFAMASAVVVCLVGGLAGILWQWNEAEKARGQAKRADSVSTSAVELVKQLETAVSEAKKAQEAETETRKREEEQRIRAEQALEAVIVQTRRGEVEREKALVNFYFASIARADRSLRDNDVGSAIRFLEECPAYLRNWEWGYLKRLCDPALHTFRASSSNVVALGFTGGGGTLASISADGVLARWDMADASQVSTVHIWKNGINKGAFDNRGSRLFTDCFVDDFVRVWDVSSAKEIFSTKPTGTSFFVSSVAISRDGGLIAVATGNDLTIRVWDLATGQLIRTLNGQTEKVNGLAFSPDAKRLAWATGELSGLDSNSNETKERPGGVWVSEIAGEGKPVSLGRIGTPVMAVAFSPNGRWLAAGRGDRTVVTWDLKNSALTNGISPSQTLRGGHADSVLCLAFSEDSSRLASGGADRTVVVWDVVSVGATGDRREFQIADRTVVVWDVVSGTPRRTFLGHSSSVRTLAFGPTGDLLASGSDDGVVKVWNLMAAPEPIVITGTSRGLAFGPDGKQLTSGSSVWSALDGALTARTSTNARAGRPAFSPDGKYVANGLGILDARTGSRIQSILGEVSDTFGPYGVSFSPDGNVLAFAEGVRGPGDVKLFILKTQETQTFTGHSNAVWDVAFSPDGRLLASASGAYENYKTGGPGEARLWDLSNGKPLQSHETTLCMYSVSVSGDSRRFATSGGAYHVAYKSKERGEIKVWDVATGQEVFSATNLTSCVYSVALSPDGRRLVAAVGAVGETGPFDVKLWDVDAGREVLTLGRHNSKVEGVAFSPDGKRIASGGTDNVIKIWSIE